MQKSWDGTEANALTTAEKWKIFSPFLKQHGHEALAYASLQHGMEYYLDDTLGYLAYTSVRHPVCAVRGKKIVVADPICAADDIERLVKKFLSIHRKLVFMYISEQCADAVRAMGFKVNGLGPDSILDVQTYNTQGNWKELDLIKRARNEVKREGITIREERMSDVDRYEIERVSRQWLSAKIVHQREIRAYARQPIYSAEPDVRKFLAYDRNGEIAGFVFYDPIYRDGRVVGYCNNTPRCDEKRFGKLHTAVNMVAMDRFKAEGIGILNIGLAPFYRLDDAKYNDDRMTRFVFEVNWKFGNEIYNFQGLCQHKRKYRGRIVHKYMATNGLIPSNDVYLAYLSADIAGNYVSTLWRLTKGLAKGLFAKRGTPYGRRRPVARARAFGAARTFDATRNGYPTNNLVT